MSDLALQLIAENRKTRETFLDLGNCGLTEIPREIKELAWLKSLSLSSEWYEWDGENWQERKSQNSGDKNDGLIDPVGQDRLVTVVGSRVTFDGLMRKQVKFHNWLRARRP